MAESLPSEPPLVDPFAPEPASVIRLYPPVDPGELRRLTPRQRPPWCNCPRMVRADGIIKVWHQPGCTEVLGEPLEAIL